MTKISPLVKSMSSHNGASVSHVEVCLRDIREFWNEGASPYFLLAPWSAVLLCFVMRSLPLRCVGAVVSMGAALWLCGCETKPATTSSNPPAPAAAPAVAERPPAPVYDITQVAIMPKIRTRVPAVFPAELRRAGVGGEVVVDFIVDETGKPFDIQVTQATHPAFGAAAAEAVKQWTFTPGMMDGRPVRTRMQAPLLFTLGGP